METKPIFSEDQWNKLYPASEYKQPRGQAHCLQYLIALKQPVASIGNYLKAKSEQTKKQLLTKPDERNFGLTPIMVSIARGNVDVSRHLIEAAKGAGCLKEFLEQKDKRGFTVLHLATLSTPQLVQELLDLGANPDKKTTSNFTYQDLAQLTTPHLEAVSSQALAWDDGTGPVPYNDLTSEQKEAIGITNYRDVPLYESQEAYYAFWKSFEPQKLTINPAIKASASQWTPPKLVLKPCPELGPNQTTVVAGEDLPYGTIVGTHAGAWISEVPTWTFEESIKAYLAGKTVHHEFQLQPKHKLDAASVGNAVSRINHGMANTVSENVHIKGLPPTAALVVVDPKGISKGDEIRWNYGLHSPLIWCEQKLTDREQIHSLFNRGFKGVLQDMSRLKRKSPEFLFLTSQVMSVLTMPKALIDLHLSGLVSADEWLQLLFTQEVNGLKSHVKFDELLEAPPNSPNVAKNIHVVLLVLNQVAEAMKTATPTLQQSILKWMLEQVDNRYVFHQVKAMVDIIDKLKNRQITEGSWHGFVANLEVTLESYDWFADEASLLHGDNATLLSLNLLVPGHDFRPMWRESLVTNMSNSDFTEDSPAIKECISVAKKLGISDREIKQLLAQGIRQRMPVQKTILD